MDIYDLVIHIYPAIYLYTCELSSVWTTTWMFQQTLQWFRYIL